MTISINYNTKVITSTASITDLVAFHDTLRDLEASEMGMLYDVTHTYKQLDIGGGAYMPAVTLINGYTLTMPSGQVTISGGNFDGTINNTNTVTIIKAAAYAVTSVGSIGLSEADKSSIAQYVGNRVVEHGYSCDELMRIQTAAIVGTSTGVGTYIEGYNSIDGTKERINVEFDNNGNRIDVILDGSV